MDWLVSVFSKLCEWRFKSVLAFWNVKFRSGIGFRFAVPCRYKVILPSLYLRYHFTLQVRLQVRHGWSSRDHSWSTASGVGIICQGPCSCTTRISSLLLKGTSRPSFATFPSLFRLLSTMICITFPGTILRSSIHTHSLLTIRAKWFQAGPPLLGSLSKMTPSSIGSIRNYLAGRRVASPLVVGALANQSVQRLGIPQSLNPVVELKGSVFWLPG